MEERSFVAVQATVRILELELECRIGTKATERSAPQRVQADVDIALADPDILRDAIPETVDHKKVTDNIFQLAKAMSWHLLEMLAEDIAKLCFLDPRVSEVRVWVRKPNKIARCKAVGVERVFRRIAA